MPIPQEKIQAFVEEEGNNAAAELPHFTQCSAITEPNASCSCNAEVEEIFRPVLRRAIRLGLELGRDAGPEMKDVSMMPSAKEIKSVKDNFSEKEFNDLDDRSNQALVGSVWNAALTAKNAAIEDLIKTLE